jgi:flavin-dependent dehydrogenase
VPVTEDIFLFLGEKGAMRVPNLMLPKNFGNHGNYIASLANVTRWLAQQAEGLGVEIFPGFPAAEVLYNEDGSVRGVATATWAWARTASRPRTSSSGWSCTPSTRCSPKARAATWASS